jgi:hypothetical protein
LTTVPVVGPIFGTVLNSTAFGGAAVASRGVPATGCAIAGGGADAAKDMIASAVAQLLPAGLLTPRRPIVVLSIVRLNSPLLIHFGPGDLPPRAMLRGRLPTQFALP